MQSSRIEGVFNFVLTSRSIQYRDTFTRYLSLKKF